MTDAMKPFCWLYEEDDNGQYNILFQAEDFTADKGWHKRPLFTKEQLETYVAAEIEKFVTAQIKHFSLKSKKEPSK